MGYRPALVDDPDLCYSEGMTTTLEEAFRSLSTLPPDMQEELGAGLLSYAKQWQELKAGIEQGTAELRRGEGIEIIDAEDFLESIAKKQG
jgi:hypothetical protein